VKTSNQDKHDDTKDNFSEELEHVFDQFQQYHVKILFGDFIAKVEREDIFKPTVGNDSLHDNEVRVVSFVTSKNLTKVENAQSV